MSRIAGTRDHLSPRRELAAKFLDVYRTQSVSLTQLFRQYRLMRRAIGASPREFLRYRLWDTRTALSERLNFLTWEVRRPLEAYLNLAADASQVRSKIRGEDLIRTQGLPTPPRLGIWCPDGVASTAPDALRSGAELSALLTRSHAGVVFKREFGGSGQFVLVFTSANPQSLRHASGEEWSVDRLRSRMAGSQPWLIQVRLTSHPLLAGVSGSDHAATLRIVTCRRRSGHIFSLPATLKLPATGAGIDNFGAGNVAVAVDGHGNLGAAALGLDGPVIDAHPRTGIRFAGLLVPHWDAAVAAVHRAQALLPTLRSVGWDVAITTAGPIILEGNAWWGVDVIQQPGFRGLVRGEFVDFVTEIGAADVVRLKARRRANNNA